MGCYVLICKSPPLTAARLPATRRDNSAWLAYLTTATPGADSVNTGLILSGSTRALAANLDYRVQSLVLVMFGPPGHILFCYCIDRSFFIDRSGLITADSDELIQMNTCTYAMNIRIHLHTRQA